MAKEPKVRRTTPPGDESNICLNSCFGEKHLSARIVKLKFENSKILFHLFLAFQAYKFLTIFFPKNPLNLFQFLFLTIQLVFFLLIHKATNVDNLVGNWPGHFKEWI
jgi:hypothetical protein